MCVSASVSGCMHMIVGVGIDVCVSVKVEKQVHKYESVCV